MNGWMDDGRNGKGNKAEYSTGRPICTQRKGERDPHSPPSVIDRFKYARNPCMKLVFTQIILASTIVVVAIIIIRWE